MYVSPTCSVNRNHMPNDLLRSLPSIDWLLARPTAVELSGRLSRDLVRNLLREATDDLRRELSGRNEKAAAWSKDGVVAEIERRLAEKARRISRRSLRKVLNASGVVIHTNLGRAPLPVDALEAITEISSRYSNLEYDLESGGRGRRETHCAGALSRLTGCEAAVVVNNNAAAVLLVLNSLAEGAEVIVSRGELVEIGDSFRIPDIMQKSGARLREVGTTNRTRLSDYQQAINDNTKLILRVHPSNYRIVGFAQRPTVQEIAELANRAGIPSYEDLGSGCLIDLQRYGILGEPVVSASLGAGISVVSFSGDKLLGGPQSGVVAGAHAIIERVRKNPLMRVLRVDKLTYAALEATLEIYERGAAESEIPVIRAIATSREEIAERADGLRRRVAESCTELTVELEDGESVIGGGSAPEVKLKTVLVSLKHHSLSAGDVEARLRGCAVPVIARTERDHVLIDLRTVMPDVEELLLDAIIALERDAPDLSVGAGGERRE